MLYKYFRTKYYLNLALAHRAAWIKVTDVSFDFSEYTDSTGRKLPMYELNKSDDYVSLHKIVQLGIGGTVHILTHEFNGSIWRLTLQPRD